jgi:2'-5' RNA ligase
MAGMAATETALIVPVPESEPVVGGYRRVLDHSAVWGVPAHVTVLYPFLPPERVTDEVIEAVRGCVRGVAAFGCVFSEVRWFGEEAVWLAPDPDEPFRALTEAVWRRFPDCPPYGGEFDEVVPHLTIGSTRLGDRDGLRRAEAEVVARLPVRARVDRVLLLAGTDAPDSWRPVTEFALGEA